MAAAGLKSSALALLPDALLTEPTKPLLVKLILNTAHPPHAQGVMMDKNQAMSFYKRFIDNNIDEECYGEEFCVLGEVIEKFGHSEQSVGIKSGVNKTRR